MALSPSPPISPSLHPARTCTGSRCAPTAPITPSPPSCDRHPVSGRAIRYLSKRRQERIQLIGDTLRREGFDLVLLQEVRAACELSVSVLSP